MALSDLAVFSEYVYLAQTEVLRQQVELFNAASRGTIALGTKAHVGDYSDAASWAKVSGLVRRRNPYGSGVVTHKTLEMLVDTMVKVAAGTPPIDMPPSQFRWIQKNPEEGGTIVGQQLAKDTLADMLNTSVAAAAAALSGEAEVVVSDAANFFSFPTFNTAQALFGDAYTDIRAWVMHSKPLFNLFGNAIANAEALFSFDTVNVRQDGFGRVFIITDSPGLVNLTPTPDQYHTLGLTTGAIQIDQNSDFDDHMDTSNGDENIQRNYQAEWSYELGVKGFSWDKSNGGAAPNDAALVVSSNWDRIATSHKDLAGVLVVTK